MATAAEGEVFFGFDDISISIYKVNGSGNSDRAIWFYENLGVL